MNKIEFWERDNKGNIIPIVRDLEIDNIYFSAEIRRLQRELLQLEEGSKMFIVISEAISRLEEEAKKQVRKYSIKFTPLLNYEIRNINRGTKENIDIGCDGEIVEDLQANICAKHCVEPYHTYDEWKLTKDAILKQKISNLIFTNSFPEVSKEDEEDKKKISEILSSVYQSALTQSSTTSDMDTQEKETLQD